MKYIDEFRDPQHAHALARHISEVAAGRELTFMEVCGTHTMALGRFGIRTMLPQSIRLISGPGCPVCVTDNAYLDRAIALARMPGSIVTTFGDMMRVPASTSDLTRCRADGCDIRVVTSTTEALAIAREHPDREVIFLGVGFETTTPTIAASIMMAHDENLKNYSVLCAHKLIPPALDALLAGPVKLDGFLLPGHVSGIIGGKAYESLLNKHRVAAAIAGFEPTDILQAIADMVEQAANEAYEVHISYTRVVTTKGNEKALAVMQETFEPCDASWRGIGTIPQSGLRVRDAHAAFDAERKFDVEVEPTREHAGCRCGEILQGTAGPSDCPHFGKGCTPEHPIGACMVSSEGTCAAYYKYNT